jgi:hypothetical protein
MDPKSHHGPEYVIAGIGLITEFGALRYGINWLAWIGVAFLVVAVWVYTRDFTRSRIWWGYGIRLVIFVALLVGTYFVTRFKVPAPVQGIAAATPPPINTPLPMNTPPPTSPKAESKPKAPTKKSPFATQQQSGKDNVQTGSITAGPCSNVQVGGNGNSATTNCVPPSRVLPSEKAQQLADDLRRTEIGTVYIFPVGSSADVQPVLTQLCRAWASWRPNCQGLNGTSIGGPWDMPDFQGSQCYAADWNSGTPERVRAALGKAGFECDYIDHAYTARAAYGSGSMGLGGITILIGSAAP